MRTNVILAILSLFLLTGGKGGGQTGATPLIDLSGTYQGFPLVLDKRWILLSESQ